MSDYHLLKPRLDGAGEPPSPKAQQAALKKKKKEKEKAAESENEGRMDGGPGSGRPGGGENRRLRGKNFPRRKPSSQSKPAKGEKEKRSPVPSDRAGRRKIKVTPQVASLSGQNKLIKTRL